MTTFYRYLRPIKFDEKRLEFNTLSTGGVCFRFDKVDDESLAFSFARCAAGDHFNKEVARRIADQRMGVIKYYELHKEVARVGYNTDLDRLVDNVIWVCENWKPRPDTSALIIRYMAIEWHGLADQLRKLVVHNERERQKGAAYITAAHALELAEKYEEKMRGT